MRAYERAVGAVRELVGPIADMTAAELERVNGIGKSMARQIWEYVETGTMSRLETLLLNVG